jgi:hypothetical protein
VGWIYLAQDRVQRRVLVNTVMNHKGKFVPVLSGGEWSASRPCRFTHSEKAPGTHWIEGWVGPRAFLDAVVKRKIPIEFHKRRGIT